MKEPFLIKRKLQIILLVTFLIQIMLFANNLNAQTYEWANGVGSSLGDYGYGIAVDQLGNTYITGAIYDTADFDPGPGIANLTSAGNFDICIAKYDPNGNYIWAKSMGGTASDYGSGIAVDANGNTYITGYFSATADFDPDTGIADTANLTSAGGNDIFLAMYDASGNYLWAKRLGSSGNDISRSISIDNGGNAYVAGLFSGTVDFDPDTGTFNLTSAGNSDVFIAKYDANGNYLWAKNMGGSDFDETLSLAIDNAGNTYITGYFGDTADFDPGPDTANLVSAGSYDIFFAKYDSNGNYLWGNSIGSANSDNGKGVVVDDAGNTYITGFFSGTADFDPGPDTSNLTSAGGIDIFYAKYDSGGNYLWARSIGDTLNDYSYGIDVDNMGNTYITGYYEGITDFDPGTDTVNLSSSGGYDLFFAKYDTTGNYVWAQRAGGVGLDAGRSIALDDSGHVYLTGFFGDTVDFDPGADTANLMSVGFSDIFIGKYSNNCAGFDAGIVKTDATCSGVSDGMASSTPVNGTMPYTYLWSNTETTDSIDSLLAGTYLVTVTSSINCFVIDTVVISNLILIQSSVGAAICTGDSILLGGSYQTTAGSYMDSMVSVNGCDSLVVTTLSINPSYVTSDSTTICAGDSILLGGSYQTIAGNYTDSMSSMSGCDSVVTTTLTIDSPPSVSFSGLDSVYCSTDAAVTMIGSPAGGTFSGTGGVADSSFYPVTGVNTYTITYTYTDANNCIGSFSQVVEVIICTGIENLGIEDVIDIYPNPSRGVFTLSFSAEPKDAKLTIYQFNGQVVYEDVLNTKTVEIDLSNKAPGLYLIEVEHRGVITKKKIVIE